MLKTAPFSTRPLYLQVRDLLVARIVAGEWKPGGTLPNEVDLARELSVSPGTVRRALEEMESERLIYRRQGRGTFVADHTSEELAIRFTNIRTSKGRAVRGRCRARRAECRRREGARAEKIAPAAGHARHSYPPHQAVSQHSLHGGVRIAAREPLSGLERCAGRAAS